MKYFKSKTNFYQIINNRVCYLESYFYSIGFDLIIRAI
jgi:hypothetical protein